MSIQVFIADDHAVFRAGLRSLLEQEQDISVVGEAEDGFGLAERVAESGAQVLLLDINMEGTSAAENTRAIKERFPEIKILILTLHDDESYLRDFLELGVDSYVVKSASESDLLRGIRTVISGGRFVDPSMTHFLVSNYLDRPDAADESGQTLGKQEKEICVALASGFTNAQVAETHGVSLRTVATKRSNIMKKLGLKNRAELVRYAIANGLLKT